MTNPGVASLCIVYFAFIIIFPVTSINADEEINDEASKVKLTIIYESLCPDSKAFIIYQLYPTWKNLSEIMELDLYTYGKAHETEEEDKVVCHCQHGPKECDGNILLACAKNYLETTDNLMVFSKCIMEEFQGSLGKDICGEKTGIDTSAIAECAESDKGNGLLHDEGVFQSQLVPKLTSVPWILINNKYDGESTTNLRGVICNAYKGPTPHGCR